MKKYFIIFLFLFISFAFISGCATNEHLIIEHYQDPYGFWSGFWHGLIIFFSCIGAMFSDDIVVYSANNVGNLYDFGFFMGAYGWWILLRIIFKDNSE